MAYILNTMNVPLAASSTCITQTNTETLQLPLKVSAA